MATRIGLTFTALYDDNGLVLFENFLQILSVIHIMSIRLSRDNLIRHREERRKLIKKNKGFEY